MSQDILFVYYLIAVLCIIGSIGFFIRAIAYAVMIHHRPKKKKLNVQSILKIIRDNQDKNGKEILSIINQEN